MPIDASIALNSRGPQIANPFDVLMGAQDMRLRREQSEGLREQREAMAADRRAQTAAREQTAADQGAVGSAFEAGGFNREAVLSRIQQTAPHMLPTVAKLFDEADGRAADLRKKRDESTAAETEYFGSLAAGVKAMGYSPESAQIAFAHAKAAGYEDADQLWAQIQQHPEQLTAIVDSLLAKSKTYAPKPETPQVVSPGSTLVGDKGQVLYSAPAKEEHSPAYKEWQDAVSTGYTGSFTQYQTEDANRKRPTVNVGMSDGTKQDVKDTIQGMIDGTIPPVLPGRGTKEYLALTAEAQRRGFNLSTASTDWSATQKHFSTLNGAQQTRIRQAVDTAYHSLDLIDTLADQWKGGRFPLLNKANLWAAAEGAYGGDVQKTAVALKAQINDLTSELGNVYMGGNSPTDHALKLASSNLSANWSQDVLKHMTQLARTNLKMRQNAIANVGAIGASEQNPYAPQKPEAAPAAPSGGISYQDYLNSRRKGGG